MQLRPYQVEGVAWLGTRTRALLADEMRLGKSAQAIAAAHAAGAKRIGVICPASVRMVWPQQFEQWWPGKRPDVAVQSYDMVTNGAFDDRIFDVLIIDEAHYLKNKDSKRTKKIYGLKSDGRGGLIEKAGSVIDLTGTPAPNHPGELWATLRALAPETILKNGVPMGYWTYIGAYCKTVDNGFGIQITGGKNLAKLKSAIAPFVLRRRYADVAKDMPPLQIDTLPVVGQVPDESELAALLKNCNSDGDILAALKKAATHVAQLRRLTGLAKVKGVVDWYRDFADGLGGKIVVFAHHRDVISALATGFEGIAGAGSVEILDGSTPQHRRALAIRHFKENPKCQVFIGQILAAGQGIDLSTADTALFAEASWVPGENQQAAMRIQCVGKKALNQIWLAALPGSIDEKISAANVRKMRDSVELFG